MIKNVGEVTKVTNERMTSGCKCTNNNIAYAKTIKNIYDYEYDPYSQIKHEISSYRLSGRH